MRKLAVLACFYVLTLNLSFGQEKVKTIEPKRKLIISEEQVPQVAVAAKAADESAYFGFDHKISAIMVGNTIPPSFPTRENYSTKESYLNVINKWIKENPSFIKPENKNSQITDKNN